MTGVVALRRPVRKVLLYSHDTYGLGHLRRNLGIAGHLLSRAPGLRIVLVSGSPATDRFPRPAGLEIVGLPPVRKVGPEHYEPLDTRLDFALVRRARTAVINDVVRRLRPDVFVVDHAPAGMKGELLDVFGTIRRDSPATVTVLGLRDILDDPAAVVAQWQADRTYEVMEATYDHLVVYGSADVFDVGAAYQIPSGLRDRLVYSGYLRPGGPVERGRAGRHVLATAGGGGDGVAVLTAALRAGDLLRRPTVAVTGPLMGSADRAALDRVASRAGAAELLDFLPDLPRAMAEADVVVTMGGYNTLVEAVGSGRPTVVVPRHTPRREQAIRADRFAERGLVRVVSPGPRLEQRLATAIETPWVGCPGQPLDFAGLDRLADLVLQPRPARRAGFRNAEAGARPASADRRRPA